MEVWKIACLLNKHSTSEDDVVRQMAIKMKEKFNKYWEEYSEILAMGVVFDPRVKLTFLEYCYSKIDSASSKEKVDTLKGKLYLLYEEYKKRGVCSTSRASGSQLGECYTLGAVERGGK